MTLLKVYNKKGYCEPADANAHGKLNDFLFGEFYAPGTGMTSPRVNIREEKDKFHIEMEAPGIDKNLLKMDISRDVLKVTYTTEINELSGIFTHREFDLGNFEKSFRVPETVDKQLISAGYNNGILNIILPKKAEAIDNGPRTISIS